MKKVRVANVVIAGDSYELSDELITASSRDHASEPIRDHYVVINGRRFPPKQVIALATGVDRADFTTNQARAILRRLGFSTGRASSNRGRLRAGAVGEATASYRASEADAMRPFIGKWIAFVNGEVIASGDSPSDVFEWMRANNRKGATMFRVPIDPAIDMGGFSSA